MFVCESCRQEIAIDPNEESAAILLALTKHQVEDCVQTPKWVLSMPPQFSPNLGHL